VGKFSHYNSSSHRNAPDKHTDDVPLDYYWPEDIDSHYDAMLTFGDTPNIISSIMNIL